jgi:hypothetical protein
MVSIWRLDHVNYRLVGSIIYLRLKQALQDGEAPLVKARVVRVNGNGFALQFLDE